MNGETEEAIAKEVAAAIEAWPKWQYDLVYVDYRDAMDQEQVDALARGDWEKLDESIDEWVSESQHESAWAMLNEIVGDLDDEWDEGVLQDWLHTESGHEALIDIMGRDTSTPLADLAANSGNVLLRVRPPDEGDYTFEDQGEIHYWIAAVTVSALYDLWSGPDVPEQVRLTEAYAWRGDVWNGGGMVDDEPTLDVIVNTADLRTDHGAAGYSWTETAGPIVSYYESKIEPITEEVPA